MKKFFGVLIFTLIAITFSSNANAESDDDCYKIWSTSYCPPRDGGIIIEWDKAYCGVGECRKINGNKICSAKKGGRIAQNFSDYKCSGGCVPARQDLCEVFEF